MPTEDKAGKTAEERAARLKEEAEAERTANLRNDAFIDHDED